MSMNEDMFEAVLAILPVYQLLLAILTYGKDRRSNFLSADANC